MQLSDLWAIVASRKLR